MKWLDWFLNLFASPRAPVKVRDVIADLDAIREESMILVVYKLFVVTADGRACLVLEKDKQTFIPRVDDTIFLTSLCNRLEDPNIEADVTEVDFDPVQEVATVFAATDLDLSDGFKIDEIVTSAVEDGWSVYGEVEYHGGCKGVCGDLAAKCDPATCAKPECQGGAFCQEDEKV